MGPEIIPSTNEVLTFLGSKGLEELGIIISPPELRFLVELKHPKTVKTLAKKLEVSEDLAMYVVNDLAKKELIKKNSPQWIVTDKGEGILDNYKSLLPEIRKIVLNDTYLTELSHIV